MKSPKSSRSSGKGTATSRRKKPAAAPAEEAPLQSANQAAKDDATAPKAGSEGLCPQDGLDLDDFDLNDFGLDADIDLDFIDEHLKPHDDQDAFAKVGGRAGYDDAPLPCDDCGGAVDEDDLDCFMSRVKDGGEDLACLCQTCRTKLEHGDGHETVRITRRRNAHFYRFEQAGDYRLVTDMELALHFLGRAAAPTLDRVRGAARTPGFLWGAGIGILAGFVLF